LAQLVLVINYSKEKIMLGRDKIDKLIEEAAEAIKISVDINRLKNELPKKYQKCFENYLIDYRSTLADFYKYMAGNVEDIYDYIPIGYNNADYLVYDTVSKKVLGLSHDSKYRGNKRGTDPKGEYTGWAEHMNVSVCGKNIKKVFGSPKELSEALSKFLGKKMEVDTYDWEDTWECISFAPKDDKILFDSFGSKKLYQKIKDFQRKYKL
jgi:hypothetical protein